MHCSREKKARCRSNVSSTGKGARNKRARHSRGRRVRPLSPAHSSRPLYSRGSWSLHPSSQQRVQRPSCLTVCVARKGGLGFRVSNHDEHPTRSSKFVFFNWQPSAPCTLLKQLSEDTTAYTGQLTISGTGLSLLSRAHTWLHSSPGLPLQPSS